METMKERLTQPDLENRELKVSADSTNEFRNLKLEIFNSLHERQNWWNPDFLHGFSYAPLSRPTNKSKYDLLNWKAKNDNYQVLYTRTFSCIYTRAFS